MSDEQALSTYGTPCPTCSGPTRETVGMVCQTCGTDYGANPIQGSAASVDIQGDVQQFREKLEANLRDFDTYDWCLQDWNAVHVAERLAPLVAAEVAAERERIAARIESVAAQTAEGSMLWHGLTDAARLARASS